MMLKCLLQCFPLLLLCHQAASNTCGWPWREWNCQCYYVSGSSLKWQEANDACHSMDSFLVSIHSQEELDFIIDLSSHRGGYSFWTGLNNIENGSVWSYTDNSEPGFFISQHGEHENKSETQCMELTLRSTSTEADFNSTYCALYKPYICKRMSEIHPFLAQDLVSPEIYPQPSSAVLYWKNWPVFEGCSRSIMLLNRDLNISQSILGPNQTSDFGYQITGLQPDSLYVFLIIPAGENKFANNITVATTEQTAENETSIIDSGCDNGWTMFNCSCYYLHTEQKTWEEARRTCQEMGADLVSIHSQEEQHFVSSMNSTQTWIGLAYAQHEGTFQWSDGSPYNYRMWHSRGPSNHFFAKECVENVEWSSSPKWNNALCDYTRPYICKAKSGEIKKITPPTVFAGSQETVLYWQQSMSCLRMQVTNIRTRQQWIIGGNSNEYFLITDNLQPEEFQFFHIKPVLQNEELENVYESRVSFLTPACEDDCKPIETEREEGCPGVFKCSSGWEANGCYCYKLIDVAETWDRANDLCQELDASLLSILSMEEQTFLDKYTNEEVWLGLHRLESENKFGWSDGLPFHFSNWDERHWDNKSDLLNKRDAELAAEYRTTSHNEQEMNNETEDISTLSRNISTHQKNCATKGSFSQNNGTWIYTECKEQRKAICKKPTELLSVNPPIVDVQPGTVYVRWIGKCICPISVDMVYEQEETGNDRRTRYRHFEGETYMSDDKFGLASGTMYKVHIEVSSSLATTNNNTSIDVLFQTPPPYPKPRQRVSTTTEYEEGSYRRRPTRDP